MPRDLKVARGLGTEFALLGTLGNVVQLEKSSSGAFALAVDELVWRLRRDPVFWTLELSSGALQSGAGAGARKLRCVLFATVGLSDSELCARRPSLACVCQA